MVGFPKSSYNTYLTYVVTYHGLWVEKSKMKPKSYITYIVTKAHITKHIIIKYGSA